MINSEDIYRKAGLAVSRFGTRDPIKIAGESGVEIIFTDGFKNLLGMYAYQWRKRAIILNSRMDDYLTLMVAAHELGHDTFHRELAKDGRFKEFELFRMKDSAEYEANAFAAHILIDTEECLELAHSGYDVVHIAKAMNSEINLMLIKIQELIRLGYELRLPMSPQSDFFKNIHV